MSSPPTDPPTVPRARRWRRRLGWFCGVALVLAAAVYLSRGFLIQTLRAYFIGRTYLAGEDYGRFLPEVDEVEIFALAGDVPEGTPGAFPGDMGGYTGTVNRRTIRGAEARSVADLWRGIPFDRHFASLCYSPYYALRFRHGGKLVLETGVCWHCHVVTLPLKPFGNTQYGFDAKSENAQKLLVSLSAYAPHPPEAK